MGFYVESADRPYVSTIAAEDIHVGTYVNENGSGNFVRATGADDDVVALAARPMRSDWIAHDDDDDLADEVYVAATEDRVPGHPPSDGDLLKARTAADNGTDPAPSITHGDVVGIADIAGADHEGRLVEEGYTDNAATTYDRASGNFLALGYAFVADGDRISRASDQYDEPVRHRYKAGL